MGKVLLTNKSLYHFTKRGSNKFDFVAGTETPLTYEFRQSLNVHKYLTVGEATNHTINCTGDIIAFSTSDKKFKTGIKLINDPIDKIKKISGVNYTWKDNTPIKEYRGKYDIGVIAQELEEVIPEAVRTSEDDVKSVRYEKIIPLLIECIKTQQLQIDKIIKRLGE